MKEQGVKPCPFCGSWNVRYAEGPITGCYACYACGGMGGAKQDKETAKLYWNARDGKHE